LILASTMIDDGAISVISDIIKAGTADDSIIGNLTIALVNLTRVNGKEGQVVEAMIHQVCIYVYTYTYLYIYIYEYIYIYRCVMIHR
jgi:hypothetical protein